MQARFTQERDPIALCGAITVLFMGLAWWNLGSPPQIYFDETHYVTAARKMLLGERWNWEHPMLGKEAIAAAIWLLGVSPVHWRIPSLLGGGLGLFAFSRLVWLLSGRRDATLAATFLLATNFMWFVLSRIAMLDMVMAGLGLAGLWLFAAAIRRPGAGRWLLAGTGICLGLALGAKWSIAPLLPLPGLLFLAWKLRDTGPRFVIARAGGPVPGITLPEAGLWLALVPLGVYWLTYWPGFHQAPHPIDPWAPIAWHEYMLQLQDSVRKPHPYRSVWYEWVGNWRAIWLLYAKFGETQRGILLIGNPFTMLAGLPALGWCLWAGLRHKRRDALAVVSLYAVSLGFWALSSKPVQFFYHYLLPGAFLMAALALALDDLGCKGGRWRWLMPLALLISAGMFVHFFPILSAGPLCCGRPSFEYWMWLRSWR
jgi:4-amino-4-deoxy-L-arabinose transferase-like glycosyltransferase